MSKTTLIHSRPAFWLVNILLVLTTTYLTVIDYCKTSCTTLRGRSLNYIAVTAPVLFTVQYGELGTVGLVYYLDTLSCSYEQTTASH